MTTAAEAYVDKLFKENNWLDTDGDRMCIDFSATSLEEAFDAALTWQPIDTAPRDGTLFDIRRKGRRYVDCYFDGKKLTRMHGYPAIWQVFIGLKGTEWMPRPDGCVKPYATDYKGRRYVP